jgi:putative N-acetylmannosamine-6-phosphate epimerase/predicted GNAT family acetyltransferase
MTLHSSSLQDINRGLIVSCQAPINSPLHDPFVIAAMAEAAVNQQAVGVRIDTPMQVEAVRKRISAPIIGLWKQQLPGSEVYITPQFHHAAAIAQAGADIIAIDATLRDRPGGETVADLIARIHQELGKPVMADIDTREAAIAAAAAGADLVGTTLYGYTAETKRCSPPGLELLSQLTEQLEIPVICEGGIASPQMARQALDLGAYAVVVGTAITGIDLQVQAYNAALNQELPAVLIDHTPPFQFALFNAEHSSYRGYLRSKLREDYSDGRDRDGFFDQAAVRGMPLEVFLLDERRRVRAGLVGITRWNWLLIETLWVEESLRRQGFGSKLMQIAEQEARRRGCTEAILDTFSLQAKGFYEALDYQVFAHVDDDPSGYSFYQLKKML